MKRTIALCLGVLGLALLPSLAQPPAPAANTGKVHGHVTNPSGTAQSGGTVTFAEGKLTGAAAKFPVDANGDFAAEVPPGTYRLVYRAVGTPEDKESDHIENVKVAVGGDVTQDIDMSRKEYIDSMTPDQKKNLEALKKQNAEALKANAVIKGINTDIQKVCLLYTSTLVSASTGSRMLIAEVLILGSLSFISASSTASRTRKSSATYGCNPSSLSLIHI